ncbi:uncharacterized protein B0T15DRAFT_385 [Chaetomium strumarium]|uniref:Secreted protein n=1 Tax=Chaetomium strumarium TaxID=1170767 RepID=A0AAJ0M584_9PEZI|nr:hypothetical protein B0T15DRAFT_385 [Chaetomium strumarium]
MSTTRRISGVLMACFIVTSARLRAEYGWLSKHGKQTPTCAAPVGILSLEVTCIRSPSLGGPLHDCWTLRACTVQLPLSLGLGYAGRNDLSSK